MSTFVGRVCKLEIRAVPTHPKTLESDQYAGSYSAKQGRGKPFTHHSKQGHGLGLSNLQYGLAGISFLRFLANQVKLHTKITCDESSTPVRTPDLKIRPSQNPLFQDGAAALLNSPPAAFGRKLDLSQ